MEAIQLRLDGKDEDLFDIYYRVHGQRIGRMDWTKNGEMAGTSGLALRIEAIQIRVFPKGLSPILAHEEGAKRVGEQINVNYESYVEGVGWTEPVSNGAPSGTTGKGKRLEAFTVALDHNERVNVKYSAFVEGIGWQDLRSDGETVGFPGSVKRIEAINIKLDVGFQDLYRLYYRVHVSQMGWLDWSESGNPTGTLGYDYSVEAMEVVVMPKTIAFKGDVRNPYFKKEPVNPSGEDDFEITKKSMVYYTMVETSLYDSPSGAHRLATIPKGTFLFPKTEASSWIKTNHRGVEGYVRGGNVSCHMVTVAAETILVNKRHGLPSTFDPGVNDEANEALKTMISDASRAGFTLNMYSGYRSYAYQKTLYDNYVKKDGQTKADLYSMRPGFSEHQTGITFDIGGEDSSLWTDPAFGETKEGKWLSANAPAYGFILRYPKNKEHLTGIKYEPWHFRYVGKELARAVTDSGQCLDEYFDVVAPNY